MCTYHEEWQRRSLWGQWEKGTSESTRRASQLRLALHREKLASATQALKGDAVLRSGRAENLSCMCN